MHTSVLYSCIIAGKKKHLTSVSIGVTMGVVGLLLWRVIPSVHIPVVSLTKIGVVLAILGAIEIIISGGALLFPSTRNSDYPL